MHTAVLFTAKKTLDILLPELNKLREKDIDTSKEDNSQDLAVSKKDTDTNKEDNSQDLAIAKKRI